MAAQHVGIVAVSPEGAALTFRQFHRHATQMTLPEDRPCVTMHGQPFEYYLRALAVQDWETVGFLLRRSAEHLAAAGAHFCLTPDHVVQHAIQLAETGSPIPWLTMAQLLADQVGADGRQSVGILGTKMVTYGSAYQTHLGLKGVKVMTPSPEEVQDVDTIIFQELVLGETHASSRDRLLGIIGRLAERGAEAVVMGSSEVPLLINRSGSPLPLYDPGEIQVMTAVRIAGNRVQH
ncbi:MAG: aspartate/glutamate racemase family protein [Phycisphaeraceae bacterium]|nr:aspartate/glutamate racemase family protein [Phycisphaeraceae bacterium]